MLTFLCKLHISLDGFVAGTNGEMNWININEEIFDHIGERIKEGNTALYGRVTYQMMESYWPQRLINQMLAGMILNIQSGIARFIKLFYLKQ